jgi:valyl-tRNA synthetase
MSSPFFEPGLVYRGSYMVNWSPNLQTAVSDLEVDYSEEVGSLDTTWMAATATR